MKVKNKIMLLSTIALCSLFVGCSKIEDIKDNSSSTNISQTNTNAKYSGEEGFIKFTNINKVTSPSCEISNIFNVLDKNNYDFEEFDEYGGMIKTKNNSTIYVSYYYGEEEGYFDKIDYTITLPKKIKSVKDKEYKETIDIHKEDIKKMYDVVFSEEDTEYLYNLTMEMLEQVSFNEEFETSFVFGYLQSDINKESISNEESGLWILYSKDDNTLSISVDDLGWLCGVN